MERITYAMVIQFFTLKKELTQDYIARRLELHKATISKAVSGSAHLNQSIKCGDFFLKVFRREKCINEKDVTKLYNFLKEQDALTERIKELYKACNKTYRPNEKQAAYEAFIMGVLEEADRAREDKIPGKKIGGRTKERTSEVRFAPFVNPVINSFIGRSDLLRRIGEVLTQHSVSVICGIGGLGKSQAAFAYAKAGQEGGIYQQVQCVFFEGSLSDTLLRIPIEGLPDYQEASDSDRLKDRLAALCRFGADTLLIVDNVDQDLTEADRMLLTELCKMPLHLLITSRNNKLEREEYRIPIEPLAADEQYRLFLKHYGVDALPDDEKQEYVRLFEKVGGHTMLIELIAKTMQEDVMQPAEMMRVLESGDDSDLTAIEFEKDSRWGANTISRFVAALFDSTALNAEEKNILAQLSYAPARGLRLRLFKKHFLHSNDLSTLTRLVRLSWITRDTEGLPTGHRIHMHPVVCTAVGQNLKPTLVDVMDYMDAILRLCSEGGAEITAEDQDDLHVLLANIGKAFLTSYDADALPLLKQQIIELQRYNKYETALLLTERAIEICRAVESVGEELPMLLRRAADLHVSLADYPAAICCYGEAITGWEQLGEPPAEQIADAYNHLANVHRKASRYEDALENFRRAEERLSACAAEHRKLRADILNNIGIVYINLHQYEESLNYYERGLTLREELRAAEPKEHQYLRDLAYSYHNIGTVYQKLGNAEKALSYHSRALGERERIYPPGDPVVADSTNMIGNDYTLMAQQLEKPELYEEAMAHLQKSLDIRREVLGPRHPSVAWSFFSMGRMYAAQGADETALDYYQKCFDIRKERLGMQHSYTADVIEEMGRTYARLGDQARADELLEQAAEIKKSTSA